MEQTLLECLDCHGTFPGSENHTCRNNIKAHFKSNSDIMTQQFKSDNVPIQHVHYIIDDQTVNCNFPLTSASAYLAIVRPSTMDAETDWCYENLHTSEDVGYTNPKSQLNEYLNPEQCNLQQNQDNAVFSIANSLSENSAFILLSDSQFIVQQGHIIGPLPSDCLVGAQPYASDAKEEIARCSTGSDILEQEYEFQNYNKESDNAKSNIFNYSFATFLYERNDLQSSTFLTAIPSEEYKTMADVNNRVSLFNNTNCIREPHEGHFLSSTHTLLAKRNSKNLGFKLLQKGEDKSQAQQHQILLGVAFEDCDNGTNEFTYDGQLDSVNDVDCVVSSSCMNVETQWQPENDRFVCPQCEKFFCRKDDFVVHYRTHTREKRFVCYKCEKRFGSKDSLNRHLLIHTGEKPFVCHKCEKRFGSKSNLNRHLVIHTGEKPFVCHLCDKRFPQKKDLINHIRTHTKERPYKCPMCGKAFSQISSCNKHKNIHSKK